MVIFQSCVSHDQRLLVHSLLGFGFDGYKSKEKTENEDPMPQESLPQVKHLRTVVGTYTTVPWISLQLWDSKAMKNECIEWRTGTKSKLLARNQKQNVDTFHRSYPLWIRNNTNGPLEINRCRKPKIETRNWYHLVPSRQDSSSSLITSTPRIFCPLNVIVLICCGAGPNHCSYFNSPRNLRFGPRMPTFSSETTWFHATGLDHWGEVSGWLSGHQSEVPRDLGLLTAKLLRTHISLCDSRFFPLKYLKSNMRNSVHRNLRQTPPIVLESFRIRTVKNILSHFLNKMKPYCRRASLWHDQLHLVWGHHGISL